MDKRLIGNIVYNKLQRQNSVWKCGCLCMYYNMSSLKILTQSKISTGLKILTRLKLKQADSKNLFQRNSNSRR